LLIVLTFLIAALAAVLLVALVRLGVATRRANRPLGNEGDESTLLTAALGSAVERLREQERVTHERVRASERLSEQIIANLASGLLVVDREGKVRILNPAGQRLLGVETSDATGSFRSVIGTVATPLSDLIDECLSTRQSIARRTVTLPRSPGEETAVTHFGVSISPTFDDLGTLQFAICLFADLSAVVDLEERLRLQDSLAQVGELTAGMAHEFRNGLATIHGYSRLLDPDQLPAEYKPYIAGLREETVALRQVVDNFLNFARPATLSLSRVSLSGLVERAADDVRSDVEGRGGTVRVRGEFPDVEGDEVLLRQALSNLCRNAFDACVDDETVPEIVIEGTVDQDLAQVRLTVSDNGPGIPPEQRDLVFRPFFTTKASGTGLGLSLTQKIIVTHNGRVTAGGAEAGGARIEVVLPLSASLRPLLA
jgi:PAS domain S-box-containing protein